MNLQTGDLWEPFKELIHRGTLVDVLKQRQYRQTGTSKAPGTPTLAGFRSTAVHNSQLMLSVYRHAHSIAVREFGHGSGTEKFGWSGVVGKKAIAPRPCLMILISVVLVAAGVVQQNLTASGDG